MSSNTSKYKHLSVPLHSSTDDEDEDDDEEGEDEDQDVGDEEQEQDSQGFHRRVDAMHQASGTDFVAPYFPLALAVSRECPLRFNFDLRLLDDLRLPCELVSRREMSMLPSGEGASQQEVSFNTCEEAVTYCRERLQQGWLLDSAERDSGKRARLSHPELQKERLFQQEGRSLSTALASGIPELDLALDHVRLDR